MGIVDDPVEYGVGNGGFADHSVPAGDGQLGGDDGGSPLIALFEEFEQIETLLVGEPMCPCAHRGHPVTDSDNIRSRVPI